MLLYLCAFHVKGPVTIKEISCTNATFLNPLCTVCAETNYLISDTNSDSEE